MENIKISKQLSYVRSEKHRKFLSEKDVQKYVNGDTKNMDGNIPDYGKKNTNDRNLIFTQNPSNKITEDRKKGDWDTGTVLITGGSLVLGLQEKKMGSKIKVRGFSGARIKDYYNYLLPLLEKRPTHIILMAGTNDSIEKSSEEILAELLELKSWILDMLPEVSITLSCPTTRNDNQNARFTLLRLREKLIALGIDIITNDNINNDHLGHEGLHLNARGSARLAMNYLAHIRKH